MITKDCIIKKLKELDLKSGDNIMIHTSLKKLGNIKGVDTNSTDEYCKIIYECFDEIVNAEENIGTIVVPTFTHNYVRLKEPFELEKSESEVGVFSEYVRKLKNSFRTLHPINSVAIRGGEPEYVC